MATLFQTGMLLGFLQGIYDGDCSLSTLKEKGDTGLGTFNGVDGELIAVDGDFYKINTHGYADLAPASVNSPFAVVSHFETVEPVQVKHIKNLASLNEFINTLFISPNLFYMLRIDGLFKRLVLRSESCQPTPYGKLAESLPKLQTVYELTNSRGTLVATYCPQYINTVAIDSYHYHYIDDERSRGGHVFDLELETAEIRINPIHNFELALVNSPAFHNMTLNINELAGVEDVEKSYSKKDPS